MPTSRSLENLEWVPLAPDPRFEQPPRRLWTPYALDEQARRFTEANIRSITMVPLNERKPPRRAKSAGRLATQRAASNSGAAFLSRLASTREAVSLQAPPAPRKSRSVSSLATRTGGAEAASPSPGSASTAAPAPATATVAGTAAEQGVAHGPRASLKGTLTAVEALRALSDPIFADIFGADVAVEPGARRPGAGGTLPHASSASHMVIPGGLNRRASLSTLRPPPPPMVTPATHGTEGGDEAVGRAEVAGQMHLNRARFRRRVSELNARYEEAITPLFLRGGLLSTQMPAGEMGQLELQAQRASMSSEAELLRAVLATADRNRTASQVVIEAAGGRYVSRVREKLLFPPSAAAEAAEA